MWKVEKCEVCGNSDLKLFIEIPDYFKYKTVDPNKLFSLMKCPKCHHYFSSERLTREELAEIYHAGEYVAFSQYSNPQNNETLTKIARICIKDILGFVSQSDSKKMFEIGCSYGHLLDAGQQVGFSVKGIEPSMYASNYAHKTFGLDVLNCTLEDLQLETEQYDIVVAISVLEHIYDLEQSISKIKEMMHKDSVLYVEVPSIDSIPIKLFGRKYIQDIVKNKKGIFHPVEHVRYFSISSMKRFLKKHFHEVKHITDPRWKKHYKFSLTKAMLAKFFQVSPTGNIVFVAQKPHSTCNEFDWYKSTKENYSS